MRKKYRKHDFLTVFSGFFYKTVYDLKTPGHDGYNEKKNIWEFFD